MKSKEEMAKSGDMHNSIHCQVHSGLCSTASIMMLSSLCVGLTMLPLSSYTSYASLGSIPLLPVGKLWISLSEIQQPKKIGEDTSVPSVVCRLG